MKLNKNRSDLELEIKSMIETFSTTVSSSEIDNIINFLNEKHGIKIVNLYAIFNNPNNISKLEDEELALFAEQIAFHINLNIEDFKREWFTEREIEEISRYQYIDIQKFDEFEFPHVFQNVSDLGNGYYSFAISKQEIGRMRKYGKFNYNENVQRGLKKVVKYGMEIFEPIIFPKKIRAIKESVLKGESIPSTIVLNAAQMSADEGIEMEFNDKKNTLTIYLGTVLDVVDGMHRILGTYQAWLENKEVAGSYVCIISNKSDEEVRLHQVDIDKSTKLLSGRISELSNTSFMNEVINILRTTNELKGKITSNADSKTALNSGELFPYKILLKILENQFKAKNTLEARQLASRIKEYNIYLFGYFGKYQTGDYSFLFDAEVYEAHMELLKLLEEKQIPFDNINSIIKIEDFHKDSELWEGLVSANRLKKLNKKELSKIVKHFKSLVK